MTQLHGLGVSPGMAAGPAYRLAEPAPLPAPTPAPDTDAEADTAAAALEAVAADLSIRADDADDHHRGEAADVLRAQAMIAADPTLIDEVQRRIVAGHDAAHSIVDAFAAHRAAFEAAGGLLAERVADLDDLCARAVAACLGRPQPGIPAPGRPFVLLARDLSPAETAGLDRESVLALVTEEGGPTSHTAILARALGLPAVVRCTASSGIEDGTIVAVDGESGEVSTGISAQRVADVKAAEERRRTMLESTKGPGRTACGHPVGLLANIGSVTDLRDDGEGVGLFRTELLYLDRETEPGFGEQVAAYEAVFEAAADKPVIVRTLDAGADKPLPFLNQAAEPNPALGIRGVRISRRHRSVLDTQLRAIATAATRHRARVKVMAPMIATPAETGEFVDMARSAGIDEVGVMIEVPAAALAAEELLGICDFLSIGTNDLSQYTFAADRMAGELAHLLDPWQPAMLTLIERCAAAGRAVAKPVGVCGEAAADAGLAPVLVGLGITSLSMSPSAIPAVRARLASVTLEECQRMAREALHGLRPLVPVRPDPDEPGETQPTIGSDRAVGDFDNEFGTNPCGAFGIVGGHRSVER